MTHRHYLGIPLVVIILLATPLWGQESQPSSAPSATMLELPHPPLTELGEPNPLYTAALAFRELYVACTSGDLATAATRIVYRGDDETRRWREPVNLEEPAERVEVEGICQRIAEMNPGNGPVRVAEYESETESEGTWHVLTLELAATGETVVFAFLELEGGLALGDID